MRNRSLTALLFGAILTIQPLSAYAEDLVMAHAGAMDVCARGLKAAAKMLEEDRLEAARRARYAGWQEDWAQAMLKPGATLDSIADAAVAKGLNPQPRSGRQEILENLVNRYV